MAEFYPQNVVDKEKMCIFAASFVRREHSSVGSEHLPYKQGVTSSNLVVPTAIFVRVGNANPVFFTKE